MTTLLHGKLTEQIIGCGVLVGTYRYDLLVESKVLIEVKSTKVITEAEERQLLNYLKATNHEVGLLLHFGPVPRFKRFVYANDRKGHV